MNTKQSTRTSILAVGAGLLALSVFFISASISNAALVRTGTTYTLEDNTDIDGDAYLVGEEVTTLGGTSGDVFVIAGNANISGRIDGDALVLGGTVTISAPVSGDVRVAGGEVYLRGSTSEDVVIAGGTVILTKDARVGGDMIVYADHLEIDGVVYGHIDVHARSVVLRGTISSQSNFVTSESFAIQGEAHVLDNITYRAPREAVVSDTAVLEGDLVYEQGATNTAKNDIDWVGFILRALVAIIAGLALLILFPVFTNSAAERALSNNGSIAGLGLGVFFLTPLCIALLFVSIAGIVPGLALVFLYGLGLTTAFALSSVLAGAMLVRWLKKEDALHWAWVSLGAITLSFITLLPIIGWLVRFLVFLVALGTVCRIAYEGLWKKRTSVPTTEQTALTTPPGATTHETNSEITTEKETNSSK